MESENELNNQVNIEQRVHDRIRNGIEIKFDVFFGDGWRIFKEMFWHVLVGSIIIAIPLIIITVILTPLLSAGGGVSPYDFKSGDNLDFQDILRKMQQQKTSPLAYLSQSVITFISILISAPLQAGFLKVCRGADKDGAEFGDLFIYYKNQYTGRIILAGLITTGISTVTGFLFNFLPVVGPLLNLGCMLTFYLLFVFVVPLIIFGNASLGEAFSLSVKVTLAKFAAVLGFTLLYFLLAMSGIIFCCIGILFTIAFMPVCNYLLYKYAVGFPEDEIPAEETPHWQQQEPPTV